ncbi:MAG: alkaline phosphatase family protein [Flavisolibacter sp.]
MIKLSVLAFLFALSWNCFAQPKLVVGIVIDQMRYDYLNKYNKEYSSGGFKKFYSEGYVYNNHHYNYAPTVTGPGHASIFTGTSPAIHGIIGNEWYDAVNKRTVYCAEDSHVIPIGTNNKDCQRSPSLMLSTTIGDQLRIHTSMQSKVIGIALKDRGAILSAGHLANGAFWLDFTSANFVTSSYYKDALPEWVNQFNNKKLANHYLNQTWSLLRPVSDYPETDDVPYEKLFKGETKSVLPYDLNKLKANNGIGVIANTPWGNNLTVDFAIAAIEGEHLGQNKNTDMLTLSFSAPDYMGHQFGPHSREIHDMYIRLDLELKRLIDYLDKTFGLKNIIIFLTADHGAADVPAYIKSNTRYYSENKIKASLNNALLKDWGTDSLIENVSNLQIFLNHSLMHVKHISEDNILATCRQNLQRLDGIYDIISSRQLGSCPWVDEFCTVIKNGYNPKRSGDLILMGEPGWIGDYSLAGGTTHGSPFIYDTHVPMLWMGWGIRNGSSYQKTETPDIAPTLAALLGCSEPNGTTGKPMMDVLLNKTTK